MEDPAPPSEQSTARNFRDQLSFIFLFIITLTCVIYLMTELRAVLQPLVWALVFVMTVHPITQRVESILLALFRKCGIFEKNEEWQKFCYEMVTAIGREREDVGETTRQRGRPKQRSSSQLPPPILIPDGESCIPRFCGVCVSITIILVFIAGFTFLLLESVWHMKEDLEVYEVGAQRFVNTTEAVLGKMFLTLPKKVVDDLTKSVIVSGEHFLHESITGVIHSTGRVVMECLMMSLYIGFWLCAPMPTNESTQLLFQRYIYMKSASCFGYGLSVGILLSVLRVELAVIFGLTTFVFNFVPEVGAFIAMLLPVPVILLDSRLDSPFFTLTIAMLGQLGLKFLFGNIVEVKMVESDQLMRMHPVIILSAVAFFGFVWGPTGMLVSVPIMGYLKVSMLNEFVPTAYRDAVLVFLEGDRQAPMRHFVRMHNDKCKRDRDRELKREFAQEDFLQDPMYLGNGKEET